MSVVDRRRFTAPTPSARPEDLEEVEKGSGRLGGRGDTAPRSSYIKLGLISQALGSVYLEAGDIKIVGAVHLTKDRSTSFTGHGRLQIEVSIAPFALRGRDHGTVGHGPGGPSSLEKEFGHAIEKALRPSLRLDLFPKTCLEVHLQILQADGEDSTLAWAITAAGLALVDARVDLFGLVIGVSLAFLEAAEETMSEAKGQSSSLVVDPTEAESKLARARIVTAIYPAPAYGNQLTLLEQRGRLQSIDELEAALDLAKNVSRDIHRLVVVPSLRR